MMRKSWTDEAWDAYIDWRTTDKKIVKRINALLKDIERNGNEGIGKAVAQMQADGLPRCVCGATAVR
jgi:toxin YoeB